MLVFDIYLTMNRHRKSLMSTCLNVREVQGFSAPTVRVLSAEGFAAIEIMRVNLRGGFPCSPFLKIGTSLGKHQLLRYIRGVLFKHHQHFLGNVVESPTVVALFEKHDLISDRIVL